MTTTLKSETRRRAVNLSLNGKLVTEARGYTNNLSGVVESLLETYVANERRLHDEKAEAAAATAAIWNDFNTRHGSFADEYSTL